MLSAAKHLYVNRARPFATLGVTVLKQQEHDRAKLSMDFVRTLYPNLGFSQSQTWSLKQQPHR